MKGDGLRADVADWFRRRTFGPPFPSVNELIVRKGDTRVSVVVPALDEEATVGLIVTGIVDGLVAKGLVDEVLVVDSGSSDDTAAVARAAGARVENSADVLPGWPAAGKGAAVWRGVAAAEGDVLVLLDADLDPFDPDWIVRLLTPVFCEPSVALVKAAADRPLTVEGVLHPRSGGRVTELVARPLLGLLWPELGGLVQPLAGEVCIRRTLFERLPITTGYGLEIGMLLDAYRLAGLDALAQADLGERRHRHHPDRVLGRMSSAVVQAALERLTEEGALGPDRVRSRQLIQFTRDDDGHLTPAEADVELQRLPPLLSLEAYREARA
ncbi:MAG: glucosyl-3-phosphoglycerate synthase [Blastococcus sp.]|jgi:glucosyl-3-phosphoglycerate synthase|nr:glucosyl-3-phosphoglycerate synthase [Blastococcus sp.]